MRKYNRVLLKLSGESLMGTKDFGIDMESLKGYASQIKELAEKGVELGIVIGGGNIFRGLEGTGKGFDRVKGDQMGMLATVINGMSLQLTLENMGVKARVYTAVKMEPYGEYYVKERALEALNEGYIDIFTGGTGNPYFTTDSAAALRALEINADALLKGTRVDGVFSKDPEKHPDAQKFDSITYNETIKKQLNVMDMTAFALCRDNNLPIIVFNVNKPGQMKRAIYEDHVGTLVHA
ncbi:uridylate kinase [candidate division MSBL1 archaeon SCGC-AAA382M17]|uniref:Uridylate kinase n=1 Tax=candidate division MSBL1 archaeon SCGC-AAA382M17 TaxID=1698284 RepID=A0ABR5TJL3_9EURY|nr:uridylate kinase [candidate division MSBL1 archaeon SCGC-AAA382M17]